MSVDGMALNHWLDQVLPKYERLTNAVITIVESLLRAEGIEYLAVTGRTKQKAGIAEKVERKGYKNPAIQLTDISGIRIIVFLSPMSRKYQR